MNKKRFNFLVTVLTFITLGYMFSGGDCGTDSDDPPPATSVAAVTGVTVSLSQASGSFATVRWNHSSDQNRNDFSGYKVITYQVDTANNVISIFRTDNVPKSSNSQAINSLIPLNRYRTFVTAQTNNNVSSDSVGTRVYAAVFENDGQIDEYQASGTAESGYGWDVSFGVGIQYAFTAGNAPSIDLHVRNTGGGLRFHSPNEFAPGTRMTRFELVGQGQNAFDLTELNEPAAPSIVVVQDNVYLLKLETNHYVKVWVKEITSTGNPAFQRVSFTYKVQPIEGLRVVKR